MEAAELGAVLPMLLFGLDACRDPPLKLHRCFGLEAIDGSLPQRSSCALWAVGVQDLQVKLGASLADGIDFLRGK